MRETPDLEHRLLIAQPHKQNPERPPPFGVCSREALIRLELDLGTDAGGVALVACAGGEVVVGPD